MRTEIAKNGRLIFLVIGILGLLLLGPQIIYFPCGIKEARAAAVSSVQSGTTTSTGNGTVTVDITDVDPAKSFLIFQTRHDSNRPPGSMIRGRINTTGTLLEFVRVTDGLAPEPVTITIRWYVVEFSSGVNVQRGEVPQSTTTINVPITPVASLSQAFVTWSKTPAAVDQTYGANDPILGELTTTSNLQFRVNEVIASHIIWWQVIEFTDPADINVQKGTTSLLGAATSVTVTPPVPVNVNSTFVLVGFRTAGSGVDVGSRMLQAILNADGTITIDRSISGTPDEITEIVWQAVELKDGSTVQRDSVNFQLAEAQQIVSLGTAVDTNRSIAFASVQPVGGQNMGRSSYAADQIIGVGSVTMALSATQITMDRDNTADTADIGWFVVQFSNCGFFYRKSITVQSGQVQGGPHTDFPMLVSLTDPDLRTLANGGHVTSSVGYDIIFRALDDTTCGGAGTSPCTLSHEIEQYDGSAGTLVAWVKVPSINNNTVIYMYYGNSCISSSTERATDVWDSNYLLVYHLHDDYDDSKGTSNATNNGTTNTTGKIADGDAFNGTSQYLDTNWGAVVGQNLTTMTYSAWVNATALPDALGDEGIVHKTQNGMLSWGHANPAYRGAFTVKGDPSWYGASFNIGSQDVGTWTYLVGTYTDGSLRAYKNGALITNNTSATGTPVTNTDTIKIGRHSNFSTTNHFFPGAIDEVRVSNAARSADWITTEYNNQKPSSTFYTVGTEQQAAPTAVTLKSFTATQYSEAILLKWKTGYEVSNLGFHIYREENGERVRLTPEPVAGSALLAGKGTALGAGHSYFWWDTSPNHELAAISYQPSAVRYWLEDVDLSGKRTMHGPVTPVLSRDPIPEKFRPELLSELGMRLEERYHHYWKVQELKGKIRSQGLRSVSLKERSRLREDGFGGQVVQGAQSFETAPLKTASNLEGRRTAPQGNLVSDPQANATQRYLASVPAVKLFVKEEGWYRVTQPELVAAGLSSRVNLRYLQLYVDGREQPIRVIGEKDGRFDPQDAVEFYGVGLDTASTDTRVYWLISGSRLGKRMEEYKGQGGQLSSSSFPYTVEHKDRTIYVAALKNGDAENFFGSVIYQSRVDEIMEVNHLDVGSSGEALLEVSLQGATEVPHRVKVFLNNDIEVGELVFEGQTKGVASWSISQSLLREGDNLVSFMAQGGEMDVSLIDYIRLTYWHTYTVDHDTLRFTAQGGGQVLVNGFSNPNIRVFNITNPDSVLEVLGLVSAQGTGYAIKFRVPGIGQKTLMALAGERVKSPEGIVANQPSSWSQSQGGYDLVVITHRDFLGSLQPLKSLRESQGLKVALVDVEDLYDEFSFGNKSPKAIKDFLASAKSSWRKPPRYVLLVGDASFDPRDYLGMGNMDFVPTKLIDTAYFETASDDWFVDSNSDGLPELAVGRLPVHTMEEANIVVSKIIGYEKSGALNEALLVADINDGFSFEGASEEVRSLLPSSITVSKIYRGQFSSDDMAKSELLRNINRGPLLVNFIGHGSVEIWRGSILTSNDADTLTNGMRLPFFVSMTCLNGLFHDVYSESLAEAFLKAPQGGAIAVWTSSGLTEPDRQALMNKELIRILFNGGPLTLGEATAKAKASVGDQDIRRTWILFGDPSTRLKP